MARLFRRPLIWLLLAILVACGAPPTASPTAAPAAMKTDLNVFAAASLKEAFEAIGKDFEAANPGVTVVYNFAGSQQLAQQIGQGAPADVFASPNRAQMDNVIRSGQIVSGAERIFVRNRLVVIYPRENPAELTTLQDLAKPNVKIVFADQAVPVGQYALDFLTKASQLPEFTTAYSATVLKNVVSYEENVRAVLGKVALGEADAGIVYTSDITGDSAQKVGRIDIPDNLNVIAVYPIGPISGSPQTDLAVRYIDYVLSTEGQQILADYGFIPAKP